jgi:phenylacetate 2-hydroxylase
MSPQTIGIAVIAVVYFVIKYLNRTDTPKIKNLPEVPGVPLFGNLLQFGSTHAKVASKFAKKFGPVFQVRLGNRVGFVSLHIKSFTNEPEENYFCQYL